MYLLVHVGGVPARDGHYIMPAAVSEYVEAAPRIDLGQRAVDEMQFLVGQLGQRDGGWCLVGEGFAACVEFRRSQCVRCETVWVFPPSPTLRCAGETGEVDGGNGVTPFGAVPHHIEGLDNLHDVLAGEYVCICTYIIYPG